MTGLNSVLLEGIVAGEPEAMAHPEGRIVRFPIMNERLCPDESRKETVVITVQCRKGLAESAERHLAKGTLVRVIGKLREAHYMTGGGRDRRAIEIAAEHIEYKRKGERGILAGESDSMGEPDLAYPMQWDIPDFL